MKKNVSLFFKRGLALMVACAMLISTNVASALAADSAKTLEPGQYEVAVKALKSEAPLPPIKKAFSKAFGESIIVDVAKDGKMTATISPQHMYIDMSIMGMGKYHCNILTVEGATYPSYEMRLLTPNVADDSNIVEVQVPSKIVVELPQPNEAGDYIFTLTVDFMDEFMGGGEPSPTDVTATFDMENAKLIKADTTDLDAALEACKNLVEENYTEESWNALQAVIAEANELLASNPSYKAANEMAAKVLAAKADLELVKDESEVDGDYSAVDAALKKVPADLSKYTEESAAKVTEAVEAVVRGLKADEQAKIDEMAANIEAAVKALELKVVEPEEKPEVKPEEKPEVEPEVKPEEKPEEKPAGPEVLDKNNLKDGVYEVGVKLWHADKNQPSMAASSLKGNAKIEVKNGVYTMYIYTQPMTMGTITASLQEMKVYSNNGSYVNAQVRKKDAQGNPTCFSFTMPHKDKYIKVKVNPHVEMMGNQDLDARLFVDYSKLEKISDAGNGQSVDLTSSTQYGSIVKTGDETQAMMYAVLTLMSVALIAVVLFDRKRKTV